jgi:hypothetical protein
MRQNFNKFRVGDFAWFCMPIHSLRGGFTADVLTH